VEKASHGQILQWKIEAFLRLFMTEVWPCLWSWVVIALLFIVLSIATIKASTTMKTASLRLGILTIVLAIACTIVHFLLSFGEAFTTHVDPYRLPLYYVLTACFYGCSMLLAARHRRSAG